MQVGPDGPNPYAAPRDEESLGRLRTEVDFETPLASLGARFLGAFVDGIAFVIALVPVVWVGYRGDAVLLLGGFGFLAILVVQCVLIATSGQSIGKKLLRTRIVMLDGSPCGFVHGVALRSWLPALLGAIPYLGSVFSLVDPLVIFGSERRCLHDMIAGTKVIALDGT